jgi:hypothetical protein
VSSVDSPKLAIALQSSAPTLSASSASAQLPSRSFPSRSCHGAAEVAAAACAAACRSEVIGRGVLKYSPSEASKDLLRAAGAVNIGWVPTGVRPEGRSMKVFFTRRAWFSTSSLSGAGRHDMDMDGVVFLLVFELRNEAACVPTDASLTLSK